MQLKFDKNDVQSPIDRADANQMKNMPDMDMKDYSQYGCLDKENLYAQMKERLNAASEKAPEVKEEAKMPEIKEEAKMPEKPKENVTKDISEDTPDENDMMNMHADCLPGRPLAMVYSPCQAWEDMYTPTEGLSRGTLFVGLDKPFLGYKGADKRGS